MTAPRGLSVASGPARDLSNARRCATCKATIGAVGAPTCGPCRHAAKTAAPTLIDAAAERNALASGRPVSQERARVLAVDVPATGPLFDR